MLLLVSSCSQLNEQDLQKLDSVNTAIKREALNKIARGEGFLGSRLSSDDAEKKAVQIIETILSDDKASYDIDFYLLGLTALEKLATRVEVPVSIFIENLESDNRRMRRQAVQSLAKVGGEKAVTALAKMISQQADNYAAIWALGEIGGSEVVPMLNDLLSSDDAYVRYNAHKALRKVSLSNEGSKRELYAYGLHLISFGQGALNVYVQRMQGLFRKIGSLKGA